MCPVCKHDDHEPNQCKFDNCGESDISHLSVGRYEAISVKLAGDSDRYRRLAKKARRRNMDGEE